MTTSKEVLVEQTFKNIEDASERYLAGEQSLYNPGKLEEISRAFIFLLTE